MSNRINSKKKGSKGENRATKMLETWSGLEFKRSPQSGGLRGHVADYTVGDIICTDRKMMNKVFPLTIEVKTYKAINFATLLPIPGRGKETQTSIISEWFNQARDDGKRGEKLPMLLMRYDGLPQEFFFIVMERKHGAHLPIPKKRMVTKEYIIFTSNSAIEEINWETFYKKALKLWKSIYG